MSKVIYFIIVLSLVLWGIGFFFYNKGAIVHVLLLIAVIAAVIRVIKG